MATTIVVPCYNEENRLDKDAILAYAQHNDVDFQMVNDGSSDETSSVLSSMLKTLPERIGVLDLPTNVGKAEAVRAGFCAALKQAPSDQPHYIGYWDADMATPLSQISQFQSLLDIDPNLTLVMGSRVCLLGRKIERRTTRHLAGRAFATAASCVLGLPIYDTQCGAKLFRSTPGIETVFQTPFRSRWIFDVEILARLVQLSKAGAVPKIDKTIMEYPLETWTEIPGSKLRLRDFGKAITELIGIFHSYRWSKSHYWLDRSKTLPKHAYQPTPSFDGLRLFGTEPEINKSAPGDSEKFSDKRTA